MVYFRRGIGRLVKTHLIRGKKMAKRIFIGLMAMVLFFGLNGGRYLQIRRG